MSTILDNLYADMRVDKSLTDLLSDEAPPAPEEEPPPVIPIPPQDPPLQTLHPPIRSLKPPDPLVIPQTLSTAIDGILDQWLAEIRGLQNT